MGAPATVVICQHWRDIETIVCVVVATSADEGAAVCAVALVTNNATDSERKNKLAVMTVWNIVVVETADCNEEHTER